VCYGQLSEDSYLKGATWNTEYKHAGYRYTLAERALDSPSRAKFALVLLLRTIRVGIRIALAMASLLLSLNAFAIDADAAQGLAKHSGCNKCHAIEKKKDGPALRDVAAKYRGDASAEEKLIKHVTSGEMVKFEDGHKEEHKKVKTQDPGQTRNLIDWILSLEGGTKY
jgi:cytochrome c